MCRGGLEPPLMSNRRGSARPDFSNNNKWRVCRGESVSQWVRGCVESGLGGWGESGLGGWVERVC